MTVKPDISNTDTENGNTDDTNTNNADGKSDPTTKQRFRDLLNAVGLLSAAGQFLDKSDRPKGDSAPCDASVIDHYDGTFRGIAHDLAAHAVEINRQMRTALAEQNTTHYTYLLKALRNTTRVLAEITRDYAALSEIYGTDTDIKLPPANATRSTDSTDDDTIVSNALPDDLPEPLRRVFERIKSENPDMKVSFINVDKLTRGAANVDTLSDTTPTADA